MFLAASKNIENIPISDALLLSLVGISVVFLALIALIAIIKVITAMSAAKQTTAPASSAVSAAAAAPAAAVPDSGKIPAPGSLGEVDLHTVDDPTAAMLMAIVADDLKAPLNTLRFISIREVE